MRVDDSRLQGIPRCMTNNYNSQSLPFVHTARRFYRLNIPMKSSEEADELGLPKESVSKVV